MSLQADDFIGRQYQVRIIRRFLNGYSIIYCSGVHIHRFTGPCPIEFMCAACLACRLDSIAFMQDNLVLRPVTRKNFDEVVRLKVHEDQRHFLTSNTYSMAQSGLNEALQVRAICLGTKTVGFLMYARPEAHDPMPGCYSVWRFMIDMAYQGKGFGRQAMKLLVEEIKGCTDADKLFITYLPSNERARALYLSLGFEESGLDPKNGEIEAVLSLRRMTRA